MEESPQLIKTVRLHNFRRFYGGENVFNFEHGQNLIYGSNATGKSTILEAIQLVAFGGNRKSLYERVLVNKSHSCENLVVEVDYIQAGRDFKLKYAGGERQHRSLFINGIRESALNSLPHCLKVVSFKAAESIAVIVGPPKGRREWLDLTLALLKPGYMEAHRRYMRALDQRNSLLRMSAQQFTKTALTQLDVWDEELAEHACKLRHARLSFLRDAAEQFQYIYKSMSGADEGVRMIYVPSPQMQEPESPCGFADMLKANRAEDLRRLTTTLGPHRDNVAFEIDSYSAASYGSQGQQRSLALSMVLLQHRLWTDELGYSPALLLDDVMAELDCIRQKNLMQAVAKASQVLITSPNLIPKDYGHGITFNFVKIEA